MAQKATMSTSQKVQNSHVQPTIIKSLTKRKFQVRMLQSHLEGAKIITEVGWIWAGQGTGRIKGEEDKVWG